MICRFCRHGNHKGCKRRNAVRDYPSCDCQHRVKELLLDATELNLIKVSK